jgi:spore coat polysaccharide biosynthesis protein SpsF (cytidylyltransferase family)
VIDLRKELLGRVKRQFIEALDRDEQAAVEAATGDMGNKPDAVKLGWLKMRTKESWSKQRYTMTVGRAFEKLRRMVERHESNGAES